jgi:uncharacterized membrane protein HdeD (DUF308 family)
MQCGAVRQAVVLEGAINLVLTAAVLIWPAMAAIAFLELTSAWAIITGALLIAAARRLSLQHGAWLLILTGVVSATRGLVVSARGLMWAGVPDTVAWWLLGYALPFAAALLALAALFAKKRAGKPSNQCRAATLDRRFNDNGSMRREALRCVQVPAAKL